MTTHTIELKIRSSNKNELFKSIEFKSKDITDGETEN